jgi:ER lumen protein retaining receptor
MTRYSDMVLENHWGSVYFNIMRIFFIFITAYTIRIIRFKRPYKLVIRILTQSYDNEADAFPHYWLYLLAIVLGFIMHSKFTVYGIFWAFSIWLEALAILPQLYMIAKNQDVENITAHYVLFLGFYRIFYLLHWYLSPHLRIYNWQTLNYTSFIAGVAQTFFYADFIYYFMKSNQNQRIINLPI